MATITIDGKEYNTDELSNEAKAQIASIQFVDAELRKLDSQAAVLRTARTSYAKSLSDLLPKSQNKKTKK